MCQSSCTMALAEVVAMGKRAVVRAQAELDQAADRRAWEAWEDRQVERELVAAAQEQARQVAELAVAKVVALLVAVGTEVEGMATAELLLAMAMEQAGMAMEELTA